MEERFVDDGAGGAFLVRTEGTGPGVVVLHGGGIDSREYGRLARVLGERCTVHRYDRRGRVGAPPLRPGHDVEVDVDDLARILEATGARRLLAHSGGAFVALRAALRLPVERLALYDPAVSIDGSTPTAWFEPFRAAVAAGDVPRAMALAGEGADPDAALARLPMPVRIAICRVLLRTPVGRRMGEGLPTAVTEVGQIIAHDGPASAYAGVTADSLLVAGARSAASFGRVCDALAAAMPRARSLRIAGAAHEAINVARPAFVAPFADFLAA
ncbi:alpha/beta fold hydrolase [Amnibacterium setariae]|uniref:Alpha/beta fold hydrolase n=1 Tax=Amnibacterium setariae TaxID=2306585 RepID=A0A3A1U2B5_9MICO|nr:alpha/beta fold hydrolase [Amnibacterium setariae]RIX30523.1 alpha/beta fold hydrolase [Amnibacterium setariae]